MLYGTFIFRIPGPPKDASKLPVLVGIYARQNRHSVADVTEHVETLEGVSAGDMLMAVDSGEGEVLACYKVQTYLTTKVVRI